MTRRFVRALLAVALVAAAAAGAVAWLMRGPTALAAFPGPHSRLQHPGGLYVELPPALVAGEVTAAGIRLQPKDAAGLRRPWTLELSLAPGATPAAAAAGRRWSSGGRTLHQAAPEVTAGGGSGGSEYTVAAWMACGAGHVAARYRQQAEHPEELDLPTAWRLVLASGCPGS